MKQCKNCGGALDDKGKCMACGSVEEFKLDSEDGKVIYGMPEEFIDMFNKIKVPQELERLDKQVKIYTTDDEHLKLANQDKPISKEELGMSYTKRNEGFYLI